MSTRGKRRQRHSRKSGVAILAKDVIFGLLIHQEDGEIHSMQGVTRILLKESGTLIAPPRKIVLLPQMHGEEVTVIIRDLTGEIILERGPDDYYESELEKNENVMALESVADLEELFTECKFKVYSKIFKQASTIISGAVLAALCVYLGKVGFIIPWVIIPLTVLAIVLAVLAGIVPLVRSIRLMCTPILQDIEGNLVNMETGATTLNGGTKLPFK